jgi:hypothetical protein
MADLITKLWACEKHLSDHFHRTDCAECNKLNAADRDERRAMFKKFAEEELRLLSEGKAKEQLTENYRGLI